MDELPGKERPDENDQALRCSIYRMKSLPGGALAGGRCHTAPSLSLRRTKVEAHTLGTKEGLSRDRLKPMEEPERAKGTWASLASTDSPASQSQHEDFAQKHKAHTGCDSF